MRTRISSCILLVTIILSCSVASTRIKDIAYVHGVRPQQLIGYGLVVGLNGTGDTQRSTFTLQSVTSMLKRFGITVPQDDLRLRNVAAVMVTATVSGFAREGGAVDAIVSSLGDATSLQGGTLLMTPLTAHDGLVYATAQGPISVGGITVRAGGNEIRRNHTAAGRVPSGALLERAFPTGVLKDSTITLVLLQADFTTARRMAEVVNKSLGQSGAVAFDASSVVVTVPVEFRRDGRVVEFISSIELLEITPDVNARVVINERTGTVVVGGNVSILPVAISHGGITIEIQSTPVISQPNPFSQGQTVATSLTTVSMSRDTTAVFAFEGAASVQDVARSLNALRVAPRDIIAIFQALKEAGALKAELVIL